MRTVTVSENAVLGARIRDLLLREGHECQPADVVRLELAAGRLAQGRPELLVLGLAPEPERALAVLRELRPLLQCPVLLLGPVADPRLILRALRAGADQYLDEADLETELVAALARLRSQDDTPQTRGELIAVLGPSGGSGASTLAVNLATVLAQNHQRCALVDLKLEAGDLATLLDLKPTHTLADLCAHAARLDRSMLEQSLVRHASGVHLLPSPRTPGDGAAVTPQGIRQALGLIRTLFPYVLVDLDHSFREEQTVVLRQAEQILLVFRLDFTSLRNTRRTLDYCEQLGISRERVRLVVSRYGQPKELPVARAEEALGMAIFHYVPDEPKTMNRANNNGIPAVLEAPRSGVAESIARLAKNINGRHAVGSGAAH